VVQGNLKDLEVLEGLQDIEIEAPSPDLAKFGNFL